MILMIDNYDSFTYNLVQCIATLTDENAVVVHRNDTLTLADIDRINPTHLIISPGPGTPDDAGISLSAVSHCAGRIPILGVCLGHQCIVQSFGGSIIRADRLMHGKTSEIHHDNKSIFANLPNPFTATRYHSLCADPASLPDDLTVSAHATDPSTTHKEIMGIRHNKMKIEGVQFHQESFLTVEGPNIIRNFLGFAPTDPAIKIT